MSVREELQKVRETYMAMTVEQLIDIINLMGVHTDAVTHAALVDDLMAFEEHAAFH